MIQLRFVHVMCQRCPHPLDISENQDKLLGVDSSFRRNHGQISIEWIHDQGIALFLKQSYVFSTLGDVPDKQVLDQQLQLKSNVACIIEKHKHICIAI